MQKNPELIRIVEFGQPYYYNCLNSDCGMPLVGELKRTSGYCCIWCEDQAALTRAKEELIDCEIVNA